MPTTTPSPTGAPTRLVVDGRDVAPLEVPHGLRGRARGLLGRDGIDGAMWLPATRQVHTFRMRFPIDVAFVDRRGSVRAVRTLRPGRLSPFVLRATGVLEAEAGAFERWGLTPGATVELATAGPPEGAADAR